MKQIFALVLSFMLLGALCVGPTWAQSSQRSENQHKITFTGGPGYTPKTAVVIVGALNSIDGVSAEYRYLNQKLGQENVDWSLRRQSVLQLGDKIYDEMQLDMKDGSRKTFYFDITAFFGKL
jgi:hypothetical protein